MSTPMPDTRSAMLAKVQNYLDGLAKNQEASPAVRFRLEGYLQAMLETGHISEAQLRELMRAKIDAFNAVNTQQLAPPADAWRLPYKAPVAPVNGR